MFFFLGLVHTLFQTNVLVYFIMSNLLLLKTTNLKDGAFTTRTTIFSLDGFDYGSVSKYLGRLSIWKALFEAGFAIQFIIRTFVVVTNRGTQGGATFDTAEARTVPRKALRGNPFRLKYLGK